MKDFFSKLTFGFFMAQFVPGVTVVLSLTFLYYAINSGPLLAELKIVDPTSVITLQYLATESVNVWRSTTVSLVVFFAFSIGAGMAVHGLHWAVLGFLENKFLHLEEKDVCRSLVGSFLKTLLLKAESQPNQELPPRDKPVPVAWSFWHGYPVLVQIALGPIKLALEVILFVTLPLQGKTLREIAIEEGAPFADSNRMEAYQFVQDFYLHFMQFYAHMSYALAVAIVALAVFILQLGVSMHRIGLIVAIYLLCGFFFVIGRIQMATLFKAEGNFRPNAE